jgi:DNA-binding NarL/FixJ family response regulator
MQIGVETDKAVDNKRLFVVAADEITRMALQFMLHDENETHDLPSLDAAFEKSRDWKPDLLLLGVDLVREQGIEVIAKIKENLPDTKILLVADTADDPLNAACQQAGTQGLVVKPLTVETVRRKVDAMLGRKRAPITIHAI